VILAVGILKINFVGELTLRAADGVKTPTDPVILSSLILKVFTG